MAASGRTAIVLGFQNASPFEQDLGLVEIFRDVGVRIVQLTYNTANHVGSSCYETADCGLTRFGKNVMREMNRVGMVVDLSHCGDRTAFDAISDSSAQSRSPTPTWPRAGRIHATSRPSSCGRWPDRRRARLLAIRAPDRRRGDGPRIAEGVADAVELMGIDHVGIGTDSSHGWSYEYLLYLRMGHWTQEVDYGAAGSADKAGWQPWPAYFRTPADFPNLARSLEDVGFSGRELEQLMGENWLRLYERRFAAA